MRNNMDIDYLRRWSKKSVKDKFRWLEGAWEFGEETKRIHKREAARKKRLAKKQ